MNKESFIRYCAEVMGYELDERVDIMDKTYFLMSDLREKVFKLMCGYPSRQVLDEIISMVLDEAIEVLKTLEKPEYGHTYSAEIKAIEKLKEKDNDRT